jgi:hypothetical protein
MFEPWQLDQQNLITFVLVDSSNVEVSGLGTGFTLQLSKNGAAFAGSAGTKAEISDGWYSYLCAVGEADTIGPISIKVTGAGIIQQNLEYVVEERTINAYEFTYTVTDAVTTNPIFGVRVWFSTDINGLNVVWQGTTDAFGIARDDFGELPRLDAGTYFVWRHAVGYIFSDPDTEVVGP